MNSSRKRECVVETRWLGDRHISVPFAAQLQAVRNGAVVASITAALVLISHSSFGRQPKLINAERIAELPSLGLAGPYVGSSGGALIVGGGTNFPNMPPWKNGTKTWHDEIYVLTSPAAPWIQGFRLPHRMAYGVSLTTSSGVLCLGGCDDKTNLDDAFLLRWDGKTVTQDPLPRLPHPTSCAAGAIIGSRVYIAGGQAGPNPVEGPSYSYFWSLDLNEKTQSWRELPTWPGPERFYAVAGSNGESFFLLSGLRCIEGKDGTAVLEYLKDAYVFNTATGKWDRLPDLPHPNAAVASPAPYIDGGLMLLGRGADGSDLHLPLNERRPFGRELIRFDVASRTYENIGTIPFGLAAVTATKWRDAIVVASGESGPGVRSTAVWSINSKELDSAK